MVRNHKEQMVAQTLDNFKTSFKKVFYFSYTYTCNNTEHCMQGYVCTRYVCTRYVGGFVHSYYWVLGSLGKLILRTESYRGKGKLFHQPVTWMNKIDNRYSSE